MWLFTSKLCCSKPQNFTACFTVQVRISVEVCVMVNSTLTLNISPTVTTIYALLHKRRTLSSCLSPAPIADPCFSPLFALILHRLSATAKFNCFSYCYIVLSSLLYQQKELVRPWWRLLEVWLHAHNKTTH